MTRYMLFELLIISAIVVEVNKLLDFKASVCAKKTGEMNSLKKVGTTICQNYAKYVCATKRYSSQPSLTTLTCNESNGVATLDMHFSPANILGLDFMDHLIDQLSEVKKQNYRALIVTSSLKTFIGGGDIQLFYKKQSLNKFALIIEDLCTGLYQLPMPTIAAMNGHTIGGGCCLANSCDYRFIVRSAKFGVSEITLGINPPYFVLQRIIEILGQDLGSRMCLEGKLLSADEALSIKWVDGVADDVKQLMTIANKKSEEMIKIPSAAYASLKKISRMQFTERNNKFGQLGRELFVKSVESDETNTLIGNVIKSLSKKS